MSRAYRQGMATLHDPVPSPGPAGPYGTIEWLRATVSRLANGDTHARRRAIAEALLAEIEPGVAEPSPGVPRPYLPVAVLGEALGVPRDELAALVDDVRV